MFQRLLAWDHRQDFDQQGMMQAKAESRAAAFQVMTTSLNLRSGPGMKLSASTALKQNKIVTPLNERCSPWLQVKIYD